MQKAVLLLSGGIDSTTTLALAKDRGFEVYALSFDYGQRHAIEVERAKKIAQTLKAKRHLVLKVALDKIGGSALTSDLEVPKGRSLKKMVVNIPPTYVPARNTIFLSYALSWAEVLGATDIFIGANSLDYSGYPDCRPEFLEAFEKMAKLATKVGVEGKGITIHAPLINLTKGEIIKKGMELGVDYSLTHSCYDPSPEGSSCGQCDSCLIRKKGFRETGLKDPLENPKSAMPNA